MSTFNDYVASSNNSINDNMYNARKARSTIHQIKQLLKPVLRLIKKNKTKKNTYKKQVQPEYFIDECDQNQANELLEERIFQEIDCCQDYSAVPVYHDGRMDILPVIKEHKYIPVHFAKTEAGTFFWTSISAADSDISCVGDKNATTFYQQPEIQVPCDRWAQA